MTIVISQPMYFPWIGIFEQIGLCDLFVHYGDVQLPQGRSFMTRVQIRGEEGQVWLSVPVKRVGKQLIDEAAIDDTQDWRTRHERLLIANYKRAPFFDDMMRIYQEVTAPKGISLADLNIRSIEVVAAYFGLGKTFKRSAEFASSKHSTDRLLDICTKLKATTYITGHGARNYLQHELFEHNHISVEYMDYERRPYIQQYPGFEPHVSVLDLVANLGPEGKQLFVSRTKPWREFIND